MAARTAATYFKCQLLGGTGARVTSELNFHALMVHVDCTQRTVQVGLPLHRVVTFPDVRGAAAGLEAAVAAVAGGGAELGKLHRLDATACSTARHCRVSVLFPCATRGRVGRREENPGKAHAFVQLVVRFDA